jgi:hypothetical protein
MRTILAILAIGLLTTACAGPGSGGTTRHYAVETGPNTLIMRLYEGGGMVPESFRLTNTPTFALYGDGRLILLAPDEPRSSYSPPLMPNLRELRVTPEEIQKILGAADEAGLIGADASFDQAEVTDMGTSVFTTTVDGTTHKVSAYALYPQFTAGDPAADLARARLIAFRYEIANLSAFLGRTVSDPPYLPASMRVFVGPAEYAQGRAVAWPLALNPVTVDLPSTNPRFGCISLSGSAVAAFIAAARTATKETLWTAFGHTYSILVRPLFPEESGCA